jgi:hypothetical protein
VHTSVPNAAATALRFGTVVIPELTVLNGSLLIYLDVWDRLVRPDEDPTLIFTDIGTETCVRLRREWAVRARNSAAAPILGEPEFEAGHSYYSLARIARVAADNVVYPTQIEDLRERRLLTPPATLIDDLLGTTPERYRRGLDRPAISLRTAVNALLRGELPGSTDRAVAPDPGDDAPTRDALTIGNERAILWHSNRAAAINQVFATSWPATSPGLATTNPPVQVTNGPTASVLPSAVLLPTLPLPSVFVAYQTQNDIRFRRAATIAGLPAAVETSITAQPEPEAHPVAVRAGTIVTVFWFWNGPGATDRIRYRRRQYTAAWDEPSATWLDPETQDLSTLQARIPSTVPGIMHAALDSAGRIWVAFQTNGQNIAVVRLTPATGAIDTFTDIQLTSTGTDQQPFVLVDEPNFIWVFWRGDDAIYAATFNLVTNTWGAAAQVPGTTGTLDQNERPHAVRDPEGGIWLLWTREAATTNTDIWTMRRNPLTGGWGDPRQVTASPGDNDFAAATADGGSIWLFFRSNRTGQFDIYFKQLITAV